MRLTLLTARLFAVLLFSIAAAIIAYAAEPESADLRYFRELVETRNYSLGEPVSPKITPDGKAVIFLRGGARDPVLRLYEFSIAEARLREIFSPEKVAPGRRGKLTAEERSRRERERQSSRGFTSFQLSHDGSKLLVELSSKLYLITRAGSRVTELPGESWIDPHFSPDDLETQADHHDLVVLNRAGELVEGFTLPIVDRAGRSYAQDWLLILAWRSQSKPIRARPCSS